MVRFLLPDIGEGVVEAEVLAWHVAEGDRVEPDQPLVELMTDKANVEIPSPVAGVVARLHYAVGDVVPVGAVLLEIDDGIPSEAGAEAASAAERAGPAPAPELRRGGATIPAAVPGQAAGEPVAAAAASPPEDAAPLEPPPRPGRAGAPPPSPATAHAGAVKAVPAVRALAARLGVDLETLSGTGPGGRIMRRDVEAAASRRPGASGVPRSTASDAGSGMAGTARPLPRPASPAQPGSELRAPETPPPPGAARGGASARAPVGDPEDWERLPLRGLRRAIARHMSEARHRAAHFTYVEEIDVTPLMRRRAEEASELSPLAFIARAVVRTLPAYPRLNASIDDARDEIILKGKIHLGVAVATPEGLVVPVLSNAQVLDTRALAGGIEELASRAREGRLAPGQLRGGTFTLTSLGRLGGVVSTPIVNHPEVAILGVNAVRTLPRYVEGDLLPREVMNLSISVDHRIADGDDAARFVRDLAAILGTADFPDLFTAGRAPEEGV